MLDFFKNVRWSLLLIGILTIVIGVAMVMYPDTASDTIVKILGGIMAVSAIVSMLGYLIDRARGRTAFSNLLVGALMLIMGAVLYFKPATFVEFLQYIFAVVVLVQGVNLLVEAFASKKYETSHWGQTALMGLICVALAVLIFLNPFGTFRALMILTGISLIIAGALNVFVSGRIGMAVHNFNKAVKAVEAGLSDSADIEKITSDPGEQAILDEIVNDVAAMDEAREAETAVKKSNEEAEIVKEAAINAIDAEAVDVFDNAENDAKQVSRDIPEKLSDIKLDFSEGLGDE